MANESGLWSRQMTPLPRAAYCACYHNEWIAYTPSDILAHGTDKATVAAEASATGIPHEIVFCKFTPAA